MKTIIRVLLLGIPIALSFPLAAQDTLKLANGDLLHGEIKSLNKSVLTIETNYSDADFKVEWEDVVEIHSIRRFTVFLTTREKIFASIKPGEMPGQVALALGNGTSRIVSLRDIVIIDPIEDTFSSRFKASISSGLNFTKANNAKQFSTRASASYRMQHWKLGATYNNTFTEQDEVASVKRTDGSLDYSYLLIRNWFAAYTYDYLSNTEQQIDNRGTNTLAIGNMIVRNNRMYLSGSGGITFNRERYLGEAEASHTTEGFFGAELNAYDIGDLNILTRVSFYPSISDPGRNRVNFSADIKYEFPLDFFIKFGYTLNYDSKPPNEGTESDFVFQTTLGWEF